MATRSDRKRKGWERTTKHPSSAYYTAAIYFLALGFGFFHHWHVSTVFENDRHFSHLSEVEREMSFRTEMGMYYSYYKIIAESNTFSEGIRQIARDNLTEYPNTINAIKKYNLFPEIIIGLLYHMSKSLGIISRRQCWQIERGDGLSTVTSCEGLGEPIYFYLEAVWYCAAATVAVLFIYATYLSQSIYGGLIAVLSFFFNHNECTRVQWTPPLRESFAYPALLYQMYKVTVAIREQRGQNQRMSWRETLQNGTYMSVLMSSLISLLCWQFSQFVFATQLVALLTLKWLGIIPNDLYVRLSLMHAIPLAMVIFATESSLLLSSLYTCILLTSNYCIFLCSKIPRSPVPAFVFEILGTAIGTKMAKTFLFPSEDDSHVFNILRSKLTGYKDFHTMLYTCAAEFDFIQYSTIEALIRTFLLPATILSAVLVLYYWYRNHRAEGLPSCIEQEVAYNALQTGVFVVMAFFIMRLKLFMTPNLCLVAGLVTSKRYLEKLGMKSENLRAAILVGVIGCMSYYGLHYLQIERGSIGEYSNIEQEQLFDWIKTNTASTAAFAGKMSLMANVMLTTRRPIVNNPYYEDKEMRERTLKVYEVFSRKDAATVYDTLKKMQVDYVILEESFCYDLLNSRPDCQMSDLWDTVDAQDERRRRPALCPTLFRGNSHPFRRVYVNRNFAVLRLDFSKYVELKPRVAKFYQS